MISLLPPVVLSEGEGGHAVVRTDLGLDPGFPGRNLIACRLIARPGPALDRTIRLSLAFFATDGSDIRHPTRAALLSSWAKRHAIERE